MSGGASALAIVSGHGFLEGRGLSLDGLVMRYRSSRAHCLHLMADLGALGDCESHLGLNSTSVTSAAKVSLSFGRFEMRKLTLWSHVFYEKSPACQSNIGISKLGFPFIVDVL